MKLSSFQRKVGKPWIKLRKSQNKPTKKIVQAAVLEADEDNPPGSDAETNLSQGGVPDKPQATTYQITTNGPTNAVDTASLYDWKAFYEQLLKT